jgi:hypothetical protein
VESGGAREVRQCEEEAVNSPMVQLYYL